MFANRLLVRWTFGWYEITDTRGFTQEMYDNPFDHDLWIDAPVLREGMLSLGGYDDVHAIRVVAFDQLGIYADPRTEIACDLAPIDQSDTPFLGFVDGDWVTVPDIDGTPVVERVQAITVTEDEDGVPSYAVELKDIILTDQERWQANLDKMAKGTLGGTSSVATPASSYQGLGNSCCPPKPPSKWPDDGVRQLLTAANTVMTAWSQSDPYTFGTGLGSISAGTMTSFGLRGVKNDEPEYGAGTFNLERWDGSAWEIIAQITDADLLSGSTSNHIKDISVPVVSGDVVRFHCPSLSGFYPAPGMYSVQANVDVMGAGPSATSTELSWNTDG